MLQFLRLFSRVVLSVSLALAPVYSTALYAEPPSSSSPPPIGQPKTPEKSKKPVFPNILVLSSRVIQKIGQAFADKAYVTGMGMLGMMSLPFEGLWTQEVKEALGKTRVEPWMIGVEETDFWVSKFETKGLGVKAVYEKLDKLPDSFFTAPEEGKETVKSLRSLQFFPIFTGPMPLYDKVPSSDGGGLARPDVSADVRVFDGYKFVSKNLVMSTLRGVLLGEGFDEIPIATDRIKDIVLSQILISPTTGEYIVSQALREFLSEQLGESYRARWVTFSELAKEAGVSPSKYYRLEPVFHLIALMEVIAQKHDQPNAHNEISEEIFGNLAWIGRGWIANLQGSITRTLKPGHQRNIEREGFSYGRPNPLNRHEVITLAKLMNISLLTATDKENRTELNQVMMAVTSRIENVIASLITKFSDMLKIETPKFMQRFFGIAVFAYSIGSFFSIFPPGQMLIESAIQGLDVGETLRIMGNTGIMFNIWVYLTSGFEALTQPWNHVDLIARSAGTGFIGAFIFLMLEFPAGISRIWKKKKTLHMREEIEDFVTIAKAGFKSGLCQMGFLNLHSKK